MDNSNNETIVYQPRFPHSVGGRPIGFLKVIKNGKDCLVAKVINYLYKQSKVIAECTMRERYREEGCAFETNPDHWGHQELCKLLRTKGIEGKYLQWLLAVEKGRKQLEEETKRFSVVRFDVDPIDEKEAEKWLRELD